MNNELMKLREKVLVGEHFASDEPLFAGADLVITDTETDVAPGEVVVLTPHAKELSALVYALKHACASWLDCANKYIFYPNLGIAANAYLAEHLDRKGLLLSVIDEAIYLEDTCDRFVYFAYGSNMDEEQMRYRCPSAELLGKLRLDGYRFALDSAGTATILPSRREYIEGLLWTVTSADVRNLDRYEGVSSGCYSKETIAVDAYAQGQCAIVYISRRDTSKVGTRSGYMQRIIRAAEQHGFSEEYLSKLRRIGLDGREEGIE